ncbi:MAG: (2Fe-2S)-binding protein [Rhodococcus sp. (in: high G+C Gram-positive bacteria)]|uniref:(2Fe-2S)-binding protein n=1 Tax=Rhodococcus sp. TaxID=1831 RepID=UPI003BB72408
MSDAVEVLHRIAAWSPYFRVTTGPVDDAWRPTSELRDPATRDALVSGMAARMGTGEPRVAASTWFFGYVARLWSVAVGSVTDSRRCICLDPDQVLWRDDAGLRIHIVTPELGDDTATEVLDRQVEPLVAAWRDIVAPGLMWGNTASALIGAGRVIGPDARPLVDALLADARLVHTIDRPTGRRRSCCLYYRTPSGGVCGDCVFPTAPRPQPKEIL